MEELIKIQNKENQQLVSARDLHKKLDLTTRFSKWVDQNFSQFIEGEDFMSVTTVTDMPNGGVKPLQDYLLTLDMAKELCMMSKTEKGKEVRKYFIQVEKNWNSPEMVMHRALEISSARVKELESKNNALLLQLEDAQPAVEFYEDFADLEGAISIKQFAGVLISKDLWMGNPWDLYKDFRNRGFTLSAPGQKNNPSTQSIRDGYLIAKHGRNPHTGEVYIQSMITPLGIEYYTDFYRRLASTNKV